MMRTKTVPLLAVALGAAVGCLAIWQLGCGSPSAPRPDGLLLITLDTIRADSLGAYGHPDVKTPFVNGLAEEGVLFSPCSDAHDIGQLERVRLAWDAIDRLGLPDDRIWRPAGDPIVGGNIKESDKC